MEEILIFISPVFFHSILFLLLLFFPPKKINALYGYRSAYSMQNQENWDRINGIFNKLFLRISLASTIVYIVNYYYFGIHNISILINVVCFILTLIFTILFTEIKIKQL